MLFPDADHDGSSKGMTAIACKECNSILSSAYFHSLDARCRYLNSRLRHRNSKLLKLAVWEPWELQTIKGALRGHVIDKQKEREIAFSRVCWQNGEAFQKLFEDSYNQAVLLYPLNKQLHTFMRPAWVAET